MKQITEDYVSFEVAKLLKEKGFDCACKAWYSEYTSQFGGEKYSSIEFDNHNKFNENYKFICSAPTHQMAIKLLREVHNLHITIKPYITEEGIMYLFEIYKLEAEKFTLIKTKTGFEKSELANEAALKYTLENLI